MKRLVFIITDTAGSAYSAIAEDKFTLLVRELGEEVPPFDPTTAIIGTITPNNAPIATGISVNQAFSNAQGQIDGLKWEVKTSSFTAEYGKFYVINSQTFPTTITVTDPATAGASNIGKGYVVYYLQNVSGQVLNLGGVNYSDDYAIGILIYRFVIRPNIMSYQWQTNVIKDIDGGFSGASALKNLIQLRRDTSTSWISSNPILASGEFGYETNTGKLKIGDGTTAWNSRPYFGDLGFTPENVANKATDLTSPDNTKYPTTLAVKNQLDAINFNINNVLENEILQNGLIWMIPNHSGVYGSVAAATQYLRTATAPISQNNPTPSFFGLSIATFETTAVAGTIFFLRRHDHTNIASYNNIITIRDFRVDSNISSDCRYWIGFSQNYTFAAPTNTDPSVHTECIYLAKLSTSNNLHIVHNDNAGAATTIDLGSNFPANNDAYKFRMYLIKESNSSYYLTIYRTNLTTGVVLASSTYHLTTNLPTNSGPLVQICAGTNNGTATNMRVGDYGLIIKNLPL